MAFRAPVLVDRHAIRLAPGGGRSSPARVLFFPVTGRFLERSESRQSPFLRPLGAAPTRRREDRRCAEETTEDKRAQSPVSPFAVHDRIVRRTRHPPRIAS